MIIYKNSALSNIRSITLPPTTYCRHTHRPTKKEWQKAKNWRQCKISVRTNKKSYTTENQKYRSNGNT